MNRFNQLKLTLIRHSPSGYLHLHIWFKSELSIFTSNVQTRDKESVHWYRDVPRVFAEENGYVCSSAVMHIFRRLLRQIFFIEC